MITNDYYDNINKFIDDFSDTNKELDNRKWGLEFFYGGKYYRLTLEQTNSDELTKQIKEKFNKPNGYIELYVLPVNNYPDKYHLSIGDYIGIYDSIDDLFKNCRIGDSNFEQVITSDKTRILGYD